MNDLMIPTKFQNAFPTMVEGLQRAWQIFDSIKNFEDVERIFLQGQGLSSNTYKNYLGTVKAFYSFTGGLNPMQVTPAWIEQFYDDLIKRVDRNTAYNKIAGLRNFFKAVGKVIPFYTSPFDTMGERLTRKLHKTKKGNRTKTALSKAETGRLLDFLQKDESLKGLQNYAIVLTLLTSGLRAFELCQLRWQDVELFEGQYSVSFTGKGGRDDLQEVHGEAIQAATRAYTAQFGRPVKQEDHVFHSLESYPGKPPAGLNKSVLWSRLHAIGEAVKAAGLIERKIEWSAHLFRRTFATLLFKDGMDVKALQLATRHASIDTLAKHYLDSAEPTSGRFTEILEGVI